MGVSEFTDVDASDACTSAVHSCRCNAEGVLLTDFGALTFFCDVDTFSWLLVRLNLEDLGAVVLEESETSSLLRGRRKLEVVAVGIAEV